MTQIGRIFATEKHPSTVEEFHFWTKRDCILSPFDVVEVKHLNDTKTYGIVDEILHLTDAGSTLTGFVSNDFGDLEVTGFSDRLGMNHVKARVLGNTGGINLPVLDNMPVSLSDAEGIKFALGINEIPPEKRLPCGIITMYENISPIDVPVYFMSDFLLGPEGAHINISGISGLATKTSYAMFLLNSIQQFYSKSENESVAYVFLNVKQTDLLALDEPAKALDKESRTIYENLGLETQPFKNVKYFYPYSVNSHNGATYQQPSKLETQLENKDAFFYKFTYLDDSNSIYNLFATVDDPTNSMEAINSLVANRIKPFSSCSSWNDVVHVVRDQADKSTAEKSITVQSWRKYYKLLNNSLSKSNILGSKLEGENQVRLRDTIQGIQPNEVQVIDIARLDTETQGFIFGEVINSVYDLRLGASDSQTRSAPDKIIIFVDELNKYGAKDLPAKSPILQKLLEITERGRSLGVVLFSVEQFKSAIHDRVTGNCSTHAYGRTNAIEVNKPIYRYMSNVHKGMLTRLKKGRYIIEHPLFRSVLQVKFPKPVYLEQKDQ